MAVIVYIKKWIRCFCARSLYGKIDQICRLVFFPYLFAVLWLTLLNRHPTYARYNLVLFWEYYELLFGEDKLFFLGQIIGNLLMLLPLGFMMPLLFPGFRCAGKVFFLSASLSALIELIQLVTALGLLELDDLFNNTVGALIGYWLYTVAAKYLRKNHG